MLVYFEDIRAAINREMRLEKWNRAWEMELIRKDNLEWNDLCESLGE